MSRRLVVAVALVALLVMGYTPRALLDLVALAVGVLWRAVHQPAPAHSLKSAILNVTADFDELCALLGDFLKSPAVATDTEQQLRAFLEERAARSYPALETTLDWLLSMYKLALPFLLISIVAKLSSGRGHGTSQHEDYFALAEQAESPSWGAHDELLRKHPVKALPLGHRARSVSPAAPLTPVEQQQQQAVLISALRPDKPRLVREWSIR